MSEKILPEASPPPELFEEARQLLDELGESIPVEGSKEYAIVLADFLLRKPYQQWEIICNLRHGLLRGAIESKEISWYRTGKSRAAIGPISLAIYIRDVLSVKAESTPINDVGRAS